MSTDESQKTQAELTSLRLLTASPKSRFEISQKLSQKGYDARVITETLNELEAKGILNDRTYAQNLVARLTLTKPAGFRKILFELKRHGVSPEIYKEILDTLPQEREMTQARELARMRWERLKNLDPAKRSSRVYALLVRQGFDFQIARDVMEELQGDKGLL